jgi:Plavaka transposase
MHDFPWADIHELLCPDLLHQVIKGTFKDHLVTWVNEYLIEEHGEARGLDIIQDIDRRYVLAIWLNKTQCNLLYYQYFCCTPLSGTKVLS